MLNIQLNEAMINDLVQKIVYEPEIVAVTRRVGTRVLYLYPQVLEAYQTLINRIGGH
ncbi:TPA: hypothetical protein ACU3HF_001247 [Staphylococcus aureus]